MKRNIFYVLAIVIISCWGCSSSEESFKEETPIVSSEIELIREKIEIKNYNDMNIDFVIEPTEVVPLDKSLISSGVVSVTSTNITTTFSNGASVRSTLNDTYKIDGSYTSVHSISGYEMASVKYDQMGRVTSVILVEEDFFPIDIIGGTDGKMRAIYDCIRNEYNKMKDAIGKDPLNDIACEFFTKWCKTLMFMSAVEICSGNMPSPIPDPEPTPESNQGKLTYNYKGVLTQ